MSDFVKSNSKYRQFILIKLVLLSDIILKLNETYLLSWSLIGIPQVHQEQEIIWDAHAWIDVTI